MNTAGEIVWRPSRDLIEQNNLQRFINEHGVRSLEDLQKRSTTDIAWFWDAILRDLDIRFRSPYQRIVDLSKGKPWAQWCVGGVINMVDNCLDKYAGTPTDLKPAVLWEDEGGERRSLTYAELRSQVGRMANVLRGLGLGKGDHIGVFMPMTPEMVVAMLAIIKIGAIFLPLFSGFGPQAIVSRLGEAKALFTADGCVRRGKVCPMQPVADEAASRLPGLRHTIVLKRTGIDIPWDNTRDHWWHELMASARDDAGTEATSAEDPMMIIYTSGTTGLPKG